MLNVMSSSSTEMEIPNAVLSFQEQNNEKYDKLDKVVQGLNLNEKVVHNYEEFSKELEILFSKYSSNLTELDYRYSNSNKKKDIKKNPNLIDKMQIVGKLGTEPTLLTDQVSFDKIILSNNNCKYESKFSFNSIRANNCIISGKWCYEAIIITNGLQQIGWCQLTTKFSPNRGGVGDDDTSYGYDGYRKCLWNKKQIPYGEIWDVGDIIGVCINLDDKKVEFYQNGKSLGIACENIPVGKNIGYFPGVTNEKEQKISFNFGRTNFYYKYPGYEPLDLIMSQYNGSFEVTKHLVDLILKEKLLNRLMLSDVGEYEKTLLTFPIFSFLFQVSFDDIYTLKTVIFNFLYLLGERMKEFCYFWEILLAQIGNKDERQKFVSFFYDILTNYIEELSLIRKIEYLDEWKKMLTLFKYLLEVKPLIDLWFETKPLEYIKNIFNSNNIHLTEVYSFLEKNKFFEGTKMNIYEALIKCQKELIPTMQESINKYDFTFSAEFSKIILIFLTKPTKFFSNKTLKDYFNELIKDIAFEHVHDILSLLGLSKKDKKAEQIFHKNIFINLLYLYTENYIDITFDKISTDAFFNRADSNSLYSNEIGIGGTIAHVTTEYLSKIDQKLIVKSNEFFADFFHKLIRLSNEKIVATLLKQFERAKVKMENTNISSISLEKSKSIYEFDLYFRNYFYLFSLNTQIIFYKISFYIIKYLKWLMKQNKVIIYFVPTKVIEVPFACFKLLVLLNSSILTDNTFRGTLNKSSRYFAEDDYKEAIISFYLILFKDESIINPEIREGLLEKINFFTKNKDLISLVEKIENGFDFLMNGLLSDMKNENLSFAASRVLYEMIFPICFGSEKKEYNSTLIAKVTNYFSKNIPVLEEFLKNYSKLLNNTMTEYSIKLSDFISRINNPYQPPNEETKKIYLQTLKTAYIIMCDLLKINEFFLMIIPDEFLNVDSLVYMNFVNIIKNLSLRILAKPYLDNLLSIIDLMDENLDSLGFSTIGIFLQIMKCKENKNYNNFIQTLSNLTEINYNSFLYLDSFLFKDVKDEKIKVQIEAFEKFIKDIPQHRNKKELTQEVINKLIEEEKICILCYEAAANIQLVPCKHVGCEECIKKYMAEKDICFICHAKIESTKKLDFSI